MRLLSRLTQLGVALIPATLGFTSFMNNTSGFSATLTSVIQPLLTMQGTYQIPAQFWRAVPIDWSQGFYILAICGETLVGVLGFIGVIAMLVNLFSSSDAFERSKKWTFVACGLGLIVWGLGFFTIGGEWFLSWQNVKLATFQPSAAYYVLVMSAVHLYLHHGSKLEKIA